MQLHVEGYKETEKIRWSEANQPVIARLCREAAMQGLIQGGGVDWVFSHPPMS